MRAVLSLALLILALPALALDPGALHLVSGSYTEADLARLAPPETDDGLWVLHFAGPIGERERDGLEAAGLEVLGYLPVGNLLVRGDESARQAVRPGVEFAHPYRPEWRRDPGLDERGGAVLELSAMLLPGEDASRFADRATARGAQILRVVELPESPRVFLRAGSSRLADLSALPGLRWLSEAGEGQDRLEYVKWIVQSAELDETPVWDAGLDGEGQILGHIDSGFQLETCHFHDPDAYPVGPSHRKVVYIDPQNVFSSHGLHTASILAADIEPLYGWTTNRGQAFRARFATSRYNVTGFSLYETLGIHHTHGSRLHTNSWGQDQYTHYTQHCHDIDKFSHENEEDLVAFAVTNQSNYLRSPENAKNVLAVGAAWNAIEDHLDFYEDIGYAGPGPTIDGRRKPEIFAPGRSVHAAAQSYTSNPEDWPNFCRGRSAGGTSMACPSIVSVAGLMREYLMEGWYPSGAPVLEDALTPSGALLRAMLINSSTDMTDVPGYPGDREGWGRIQMNLGLKLGEDSPIDQYLQDFRHTEGLNTGQERIYTFAVGDDSLDLKVTMAFTDYPAEVNANPAVVNDLDLHLTSPTGQEYWGNWFADGYSTPGGERDPLNSVERVVVSDPDIGAWTLRVIGEDVPMGPQGFAFIVSGQLTDSDVVPPSLSLSKSIDEDTLHLLFAASEPLDEETVEVHLSSGGWSTDLDATPVEGIEGEWWEASFTPEQDFENLNIQICAQDLAGNQGCIFDEAGLYMLAAGQSAYLLHDDDRLGIDVPPEALEEDALVMIYPAVGSHELAYYAIDPPISLSAPALIEWKYADVEFPLWATEENLEMHGLSVDPLDTYFDPERQVIIGTETRLSTIRVSWGFSGSSSELNATFAQLGEAFPNPYRPLSHGDIRFALEVRDAQQVKAEVYDVVGRRVAVLHEDWLMPGHHQLIWDGHDSEGEELASGIYFLRLDSNGGVLTRKLVMVR